MTKTLFDFCTLAEGTRDTDTIRVTACARFGNTDAPERRMEERLLLDSEYTLLRGGEYVVPEDIKAVAVPVLAHRLQLSGSAGMVEAQKKVIEEILSSLPLPTEDWSK